MKSNTQIRRQLGSGMPTGENNLADMSFSVRRVEPVEEEPSTVPSYVDQYEFCAALPTLPPSYSIINNEELARLYVIASGKEHHTFDCATICAPAETPGPCDCDA